MTRHTLPVIVKTVIDVGSKFIFVHERRNVENYSETGTEQRVLVYKSEQIKMPKMASGVKICIGKRSMSSKNMGLMT